MKLKTKRLILPAVLVIYAALYVATSYPAQCSEDCMKINQLDTTLAGKFTYYYGAYRCTYFANTDTLCIYVKDSTGINWNNFADTVCIYANSVGLYNQKLFVLRYNVFPPDTLARKNCP